MNNVVAEIKGLKQDCIVFNNATHMDIPAFSYLPTIYCGSVGDSSERQDIRKALVARMAFKIMEKYSDKIFMLCLEETKKQLDAIKEAVNADN
jgi:hypothetical protein